MANTATEVLQGKKKADLAVIGGKLVNVLSREIYQADVAVAGDTIVAVGDISAYIDENTRSIDASGKFVAPGFIDGHIHPESSNLSMGGFAEVMLKHGTTSIMTDLHEVGVVAGLEGIEAMLDELKETDLNAYFVVPSHVPFAPNLETSGGIFNPEIIEKALQRDDAVGLSEIVAPYVLMGFPELKESMGIAKRMGKSLQGHLPETSGAALDICLAEGIVTDHESMSKQEALEHVRKGCHLMMREGSAARNMPELVKIITEDGLDPTLCSIVTDDIHTIDAVDHGDLDASLRTAISLGVDFITAIQLVTINAARAFHLDWKVGSIAPGRRADITILEDDKAPQVRGVVAGGKEVLRDGELQVDYPKAQHAPCLLDTVVLPNGKMSPEDFAIRVEDPAAVSAKVKAMRTLDWIPITIAQEAVLPVKDGIIRADLEQDVIHIAQVERYGINGNIGKAFMAGFNLKEGAMASSIAHDNHNIIVIGTNFEDMALAVNRCAELQGGQVIVNDGKVTAEVSFPVCGLLSDLGPEELADKKRELIAASRAQGSNIGFPFLFLSFIGLAAIPEYAITDKGFIDVMKQQIIDPVEELIV